MSYIFASGTLRSSVLSSIVCVRVFLVVLVYCIRIHVSICLRVLVYLLFFFVTRFRRDYQYINSTLL